MPELMCHWVAGYPDAKGFSEVVSVLDTHPDTTWLEIQLPFTDPLADGPVIMAANHGVLGSGQRTPDAFDQLDEIRGQRKKKLAVMTYANLPLVMGPDRFMERLVRCGADGLIVPDLPFDTPEGEALIWACKSNDIAWIPVVSPGMKPERLRQLLAFASSMVYVTSKVGVTGSDVKGLKPALELVAALRSMTDLPLALGFGIRTAEAIRSLAGLADIAIVGSHLLRLYQADGLEGIARFLEEL
jgi:tryptophan synthase alpha chain